MAVPTGYHLTFGAEFNDPAQPLFNAQGGPFTPYLAHWTGQSEPPLRRFADNNEQQTYVDPSFGDADAYNPFKVENGALTITAIPTPVGLQDVVSTPYVSGVLETSGGPAWEGAQPDGFWQQYGYWEMRAQLPAGQGLWPAFWLVSWGEVDIMEALGQDTHTVYHSTHDFRDSPPTNTSTAATMVSDYASGFHTYGLQWTPDVLIFSIDGTETARLDGAQFRDFGESFMVVNLAVGGNWGGLPDASTTFPAQMTIDYIRAYQADPIPPPPQNLTLTGTSGSNTLTGDAGNDTISGLGGDDRLSGAGGNDRIDGGSGNDTLSGGAGNDVMTGGSGVDTITFGPGFGHDTVTDFQAKGGNHDYLSFDRTLFSSVADLLAHTDNLGAGGYARIVFDANNDITLTGVRKADLLSSDFILS